MEGKDATFKFLEKINKFEVPYFQRSYVWNENNWEQLLREWEYGEIDHFLGSIVLNNPQLSSTKGKYVEIIDGQQRLTTLTILYKACFDLVIKNKKDDLEAIGREKGKKENILGLEDDLKITHSKLDIDYYKSVMKDDAFDMIGDIVLQSEADAYNYKKKKNNRKCASNNILQCYKYFINSLSNDYINKLNMLWDDLNSSTKKLFVVIDVFPGENAQQIFDCINSAGIRLTSADIVKNNLFKKVKSIITNNKKLDSLYKEYWGDIFEKDEDTKKYWDTVISVGRYKRDNLEMLLYCYALIKGIYDPEENTIDNIARLYKDKIDAITSKTIAKLESYMKEFKEYALVYRKYINFNKDDEYTYDNKLKLFMLIIDVLDTTTFCAYILKILKKKPPVGNEIPEELNILQKLILRAAICNDSSTIKDYNKQCFNLVIGKKTVKKYYKDRLDIGNINNDAVINALHNVTSNKIAKIVLFLIELKNRNDKKKTEQELKYVYQTEHLMPVKYDKYWGFDKVPVKQKVFDNKSGKDKWRIESKNRDLQTELRENAIYEIGNMTLLTSSLNQSYGNKSMKEKYPKLKSYASNIIITTEFLADYEKKKIWDEETISNRSNCLIKEFMPFLK